VELFLPHHQAKSFCHYIEGAMVKHIALIAAIFVAAQTAAVSAAGSVQIQQSNGAVKTYAGVTLRVAHASLTLISADKVSTVVIGGADCVPVGNITRCSGGNFALLQDGKKRAIAGKASTFYVNSTNRDLTLPLSTAKIAAHSVVFALETAKGTDVTGSGKLDSTESPL
jgi:hypothetical protein